MAEFSDIVNIPDATCLHETAKAILVQLHENKLKLWFPLSQLDDRSEVKRSGDVGILRVSLWIWHQKLDEIEAKLEQEAAANAAAAKAKADAAAKKAQEDWADFDTDTVATKVVVDDEYDDDEDDDGDVVVADDDEYDDEDEEDLVLVPVQPIVVESSPPPTTPPDGLPSEFHKLWADLHYLKISFNDERDNANITALRELATERREKEQLMALVEKWEASPDASRREAAAELRAVLKTTTARFGSLPRKLIM